MADQYTPGLTLTPDLSAPSGSADPSGTSAPSSAPAASPFGASAGQAAYAAPSSFGASAGQSAYAAAPSPFGASAGQAAYAAAPSPFGASAAAMPTLTLDPFAQQAAPAVQEAPKPEVKPVELNDAMLTPEERRAVEEFSKKIDITNSNMILQYGAAAQKNIAEFSDNALQSVRNKDLGEVGESLSALVASLDNFGKQEEKKGFMGFFKKTEDKLQTMKAQYSKVEGSVDQISKQLQQHQITLLKDVAMLDQMYEKNLQYYKELTMYILAGKKRLAEVEATDLAAIRARAEQTGSQEDAQRYNDMQQLCQRFEKKIHDLELTRMISIQMGPQTRMLQNNDTQLVEKIQSSLVNTIPLWKSQMVLSLGLEHGRQAVAAQNAVTEMTNQLLQKNADMLKMGTIATAREAERSIVDIETLQHTNQQLISTLDEVLTIQRDGAARRKAAEAELGRIEGELRQKLMELR